MRGLVNVFKFLVPILILVAGIAFVAVFEFYLKDKIGTVEVVVASENINFKDKITEDDLTVKRVKREDQVENSYRPDEIEYILGEYASINIKKGTQIYPDLIDNYDLIPDESKGEFIAPIPNKWLFAVPGSIRKSYIADIYVIGNKEVNLLESLLKDSQEYEKEVDEENNGEEAEQKKAETHQVKVTNKEAEEKLMDIAVPILTDVRVAGVKDSGNREVQARDSNNPESGTGNVTNIEIIATNEMLKTIKDYTTKGYSLYIVYKYERSQDADDSDQNDNK